MTTAPLDPRRLPLDGIRLIEASAGTGKTWTLAALYLRLVLGHGGGVPRLPAQILVMTFTRAATAELHERIRARLAEAARAFRGQAAADDFLQALIDDHADPDLRARAARQLELAAQWMDEAAVYTIHGWCQRVLGQHAFASGELPAANGIADEAGLLGEAVRDYWRRYFFPLGRDAAALVARLWRTPDDLQGEVTPLLDRPPGGLLLAGQPVPARDDPAVLLDAQAQALGEAQARARDAWRDGAEEIEAMLPAAVQAKVLHGNKVRARDLPRHFANMRAWAGGDEIDPETLERFGQQRLDASVNGDKTAPVHPAFHAIDRLLAVQAESAGLAPRLLAHAAPWIARRRDEARRQRAQLGHDDMLRRLDDALHGPRGEALAALLAAQYPVALVDEFQDTDPVQWRILRRIYAGRGGTALLLIGDPKQAIYAFRGADIHTYLRARDAAAQPTWTLATNHRSTEGLVRAVNRVFEHAATQPLGAFGFGDRLPFVPVDARGRRERLLLDDRPLPALTCAAWVSETPLALGAYREGMAEHAAAQLARWLGAAQAGRCGFAGEDGGFEPLRPRDVAVLVRSRHEAGLMRAALQRRGLACVFLSDRDSVYASAEARDLALWLAACTGAASDAALRAALATPTMGWRLDQLDRLERDETFRETCAGHLRELHALWQRHGVLAMLHDLLHRFELPARLLARADGERALTNLLHLAELLQQAATGLDGEHALIRHLAAQIARAGTGETAEEHVVRLESETELVKLVTVHKSKGLEYPVVLLPFICGFRETRRDAPCLWHDRDGQPRLDLRPDERAWQQAERERLQEDLRLLYVALTRARHACWLGLACVRDGQKNASGLHKSAIGYVLSGGEPIAPDALTTRLETLRDGRPDVHILTLDETADATAYRASRPDAAWQPARRCTLAPPVPWWIASYSALAHAEATAAAPETPTQDVLAETALADVPAEWDAAPAGTPRGIHGFDRGAGPGTFLHGLLEWAALEGFGRAAAAPAAVQDTIARRCQTRGWQRWIGPLSQWLPRLLRQPLPLPDGRRASLAGLARYRAELEFWFEARGVDTATLDRLVTRHTLDGDERPALAAQRVNGMLKGFIDLVFEHEGRYYVVDYKSNWLGPDAPAYTHQAMRASVLAARYDLQYALYTLALHRQLRARLPGYDYERHMGGVAYLYLRGVDEAGHGVFHERLPYALVAAMDALFAGQGERDDA